MDIEQARFNMIEQQIRPWDVLDVDVLRVIEKTPRELFVPEQFRNLAFTDMEIPLIHNQVMMAPKVEARMLQALQINENDEILEIGTGSGFVTACLAKLGNHVDTVEYFEDLSQQAQNKLKQYGIKNVQIDVQDVLANPLLSKQYDVIAITASMPVYSDMFEKYLKNNGRLFVITGRVPVMQAKLVTCVNEGEFTQSTLFETNLPPLIGMHTPREFEL